MDEQNKLMRELLFLFKMQCITTIHTTNFEGICVKTLDIVFWITSFSSFDKLFFLTCFQDNEKQNDSEVY